MRRSQYLDDILSYRYRIELILFGLERYLPGLRFVCGPFLPILLVDETRRMKDVLTKDVW